MCTDSFVIVNYTKKGKERVHDFFQCLLIVPVRVCDFIHCRVRVVLLNGYHYLKNIIYSGQFFLMFF